MVEKLKNPLFYYFANKKIQQKTKQENSQDKRAGIFKNCHSLQLYLINK